MRCAHHIVCALLVALSIATATRLHAATLEPPTTKPISPEEAIYRAQVKLAKILLEEPSNDELFELGKNYRRREDFALAAVLDLTALRGKPNDALIEYELACNFGNWEQKKLAAKYLARAADHGYWGYRVLIEDTDLKPISTTPEFAAAAKKIKASFDAESPKHAPGMTVVAPNGEAPAGGWPVLVFLHGWAASRHNF